MVSLSYHRLPTRSTFRLSRSWVVWLRVILLGIMIPFGIAGIVADQFYLKGLQENNLQWYQTAKQIFPFEKEILVGPGNFFITNRIISLEALKEIDEALKYDLYSAQFLNVETQYQFAFKNYSNALVSYKRLKLISPRVSKILSERFKE